MSELRDVLERRHRRISYAQGRAEALHLSAAWFAAQMARAGNRINADRERYRACDFAFDPEEDGFRLTPTASATALIIAVVLNGFEM